LCVLDKEGLGIAALPDIYL